MLPPLPETTKHCQICNGKLMLLLIQKSTTDVYNVLKSISSDISCVPEIDKLRVSRDEDLLLAYHYPQYLNTNQSENGISKFKVS